MVQYTRMDLSSLQIKFFCTVLACGCATSLSFVRGGIVGIVMGMIKGPGILQTPKLSCHWVDSLQNKFIGTVLACRCATSWSFAHGGIVGIPVGSWISQTLELGNHWADSPQTSSLKPSWHVDVQHNDHLLMRGITDVPIGIIRAHGILRTLEISNHWAASLHIKIIWTALACRCATSWSFVHMGIMGMPTGVIRASGILQMLELSNHWTDSLQI